LLAARAAGPRLLKEARLDNQRRAINIAEEVLK
jgi:hypothetical protein